MTAPLGSVTESTRVPLVTCACKVEKKQALNTMKGQFSSLAYLLSRHPLGLVFLGDSPGEVAVNFAHAHTGFVPRQRTSTKLPTFWIEEHADHGCSKDK